MALYVRSLRLLLLLLLRHVIAIFLSGVGRARERPGTRYRRVCDKKGPGKSERVLLSSVSPPPLQLAPSSSRHRRRQARNSFSVPVPSGAVTFRTDRKREAWRIPPPRFGTRTTNLFAQRQVAYGAVLISVRVSGLVLPAPARYAAAAAAAAAATVALVVETFSPLSLDFCLGLCIFSSNFDERHPRPSPSLSPVPSSASFSALPLGDSLDR